jgi:hypothetical protein
VPNWRSSGNIIYHNNLSERVALFVRILLMARHLSIEVKDNCGSLARSSIIQRKVIHIEIAYISILRCSKLPGSL